MFRENFAIYTDPRNGGKTGAYTPVGGAAKNVDGNFRRPFDAAAGMEGSEPWFGCARADLPAPPAHGASVVVEGVAYKVVGVEEDGTGWVELRLELADG